MKNWMIKEKENNNHIIIVKKDGTTEFNKDDFWINGDTVKISPLHNSDTFRIFHSTYDKFKYVVALMNYMNDEERIDLHNRLEQLLKMFIDKNISIQYDESLKIKFKTDNENNETIDQDDIYVYRKNKKIKYFYADNNGKLFKAKVDPFALREIDYGEISFISYLNFKTFMHEENVSYEEFILDTKYAVISDPYNKMQKLKDKGFLNLKEIKKEYRIYS